MRRRDGDPIDPAESQLWVRCARCWGRDRACPTCQGSGHEEVFGDPWEAVTEESWELLALARDFPQVLPLAGGLYDQPARYVKAMRWIRAAKEELEEQIALAEQAERESRNG